MENLKPMNVSLLWEIQMNVLVQSLMQTVAQQGLRLKMNVRRLADAQGAMRKRHSRPMMCVLFPWLTDVIRLLLITLNKEVIMNTQSVLFYCHSFLQSALICTIFCAIQPLFGETSRKSADAPVIGKCKLSGVVNVIVSPQEQLDKLASVKTFDEMVTLNSRSFPSNKGTELSGIVVTVRNKFASSQITTQTDATGKFILEGLPDGHYEVSAEKDVIRDAKRVKARARFLIDLSEREFAWLNLRTDLVTLKGKVVTPDGVPLAGIRVRAEANFGDEATSEWYLRCPGQCATSAPDGSFELKDLVPAEYDTVASYLMNTNSLRNSSSLFSARLYVENSPAVKYFTPVQIVPLISEETLAYARRYISLMDKLTTSQKGHSRWTEQEGVSLPLITGNVITIPNIIINQK
ncbi:MAG: carboxypeptidase-like regulatory domain-containing protein [Kiritimatiellae bacterium]|nr:carboxypeptidase-like regulatory domain-containing protein [Kiritimatiellia bacterium]